MCKFTEKNLHGISPLNEHAGLSGAKLFRARLADDRLVILKQSCAAGDEFQQLLGHTISLEYLLWQEGVFDQLPDNVRCPILGGWIDNQGETVVVMEDVGRHLFGGDHNYNDNELRNLLRGLHLLHHSGIRPRTPITSLERVINTFGPLPADYKRSQFLEPFERGLEALSIFCSPKLHKAIIAFSHDESALARKLLEFPLAFCHGDIAGDNAGLDGDELILIDWGQAYIGPPELDLARFLPSGLRYSSRSNDWLIETYSAIAGTSFSAKAMRLSLLATLVWIGWRKAIDALEHPDLSRREIERNELKWWNEHASAALHDL